MSKHAPGPWTHMAGLHTNVLSPSGMRVARCDFDGDFDSPEAIANASLIAAAPELLMVAQMVLDTATVETPQALLDTAIKAIAKATGEAS